MKETKIHKKKRGFTLVELMAVLAIIAVLMTVLTPKVVGFVNEANKSKALSEVRQVILAVDTYNVKASTSIVAGDTFSSIKSKVGTEMVDCSSIKSIAEDTTYDEMRKLVDGSLKFSLNNGVITIT